MKTFEERFTAWVDGKLEGKELVAFERELEARPEAGRDRVEALEIGKLLRENLVAPPLKNADFFNDQIMRQIQPVAVKRGTFWSLPRMAFSGVGLLALSALLYFAAVPNTRREMKQHADYTENILHARSDDPHITATSFHSNADNVNVVWLDGLDYMPPDHKLK
jgi:hypothetical protein